jgi:hypothetical protein
MRQSYLDGFASGARWVASIRHTTGASVVIGRRVMLSTLTSYDAGFSDACKVAAFSRT